MTKTGCTPQFGHPAIFSRDSVDGGGTSERYTMADSKQGSYDPKKGGKFTPQTKAKPPPPPRPGRNKDK